MKLIMTAPKFLNIAALFSVVASALFSVVALVVKIMWLNKIQEKFDGAHELGLIVEAVLLSFVASYVFYLVVVQLKEMNDKKVIYPLILKWSNIVVGSCSGQLNEISKASGISLELENITKEMVSEAFKKVDPNGQAPLLLVYPNIYANWLQYMIYHEQRTKEYADKVISQMLYVESQFISKVVEVEDCSHFKHVKSIGSGPINNANMSFMAGLFYDYCMLCRELKAQIEGAKVKYG